MNSYIEALKNTTKTERVFVIFVVLSSIALRYISLSFGDLFFYGLVSIYCVYTSFFKEKNLSIKNRLIGAFIGGTFIWMFIESLSKLFAKWAIWSFS